MGEKRRVREWIFNSFSVCQNKELGHLFIGLAFLVAKQNPSRNGRKSSKPIWKWILVVKMEEIREILHSADLKDYPAAARCLEWRPPCTGSKGVAAAMWKVAAAMLKFVAAMWEAAAAMSVRIHMAAATLLTRRPPLRDCTDFKLRGLAPASSELRLRWFLNR